MKAGIVGLPNVGKSTLFNAITKAGIDANNYPFCTIEPNIGIVEVPDIRINELAKIVTPEKYNQQLLNLLILQDWLRVHLKGKV